MRTKDMKILLGYLEEMRSEMEPGTVVTSKMSAKYSCVLSKLAQIMEGERQERRAATE
jgi:hypothetical protein